MTIRAIRFLISLLSLALPWPLRRLALNYLIGYDIHPTARIGFSLVVADELKMARGSRIGNLNVFKGLQRVYLDEGASIGNLNWITGYPKHRKWAFQQEDDRCPELSIGFHGRVSNRHLIDCTNRVEIGAFTRVAGFHSVILTHGTDLGTLKQRSKPVRIGSFCFVGTNCVVLSGSTLPDFSVLGAGALLNKPLHESYMLYAGNPVKQVKSYSRDFPFFNRTIENDPFEAKAGFSR